MLVPSCTSVLAGGATKQTVTFYANYVTSLFNSNMYNHNSNYYYEMNFLNLGFNFGSPVAFCGRLPTAQAPQPLLQPDDRAGPRVRSWRPLRERS